jgi:hypothetical protein
MLIRNTKCCAQAIIHMCLYVFAETRVQVSEHWSESVVLWCVVAARRGEKKTLALNHTKAAVRKLEKDIQARHRLFKGDEHDSKEFCYRFLVDEFTLDATNEIIAAQTALNANTNSHPHTLLAMVDNLGTFLRGFDDSLFLIFQFRQSSSHPPLRWPVVSTV